MTRGLEAVSLALALALLAPLQAAACPLCIAAQDENVQLAYVLATVFMTTLPLSLVGGFVLWLRRRARQLERENYAGVARLPTASERGGTAV